MRVRWERCIFSATTTTGKSEELCIQQFKLIKLIFWEKLNRLQTSRRKFPIRSMHCLTQHDVEVNDDDADEEIVVRNRKH